MHKYTDTEGTTRRIVLNFGTVRRVRHELDINLLTAFDADANGEPVLLARLQDPETALEVLRLTSSGGLEQTQEAFEAVMDQDTLQEGIFALLREIAFFSPAATRETMAALVEKVIQSAQAAQTEAADVLRSALEQSPEQAPSV